MASTSSPTANIDSDLKRLSDSLTLTEDEEAGFMIPLGVWHANPVILGFLVVGHLPSNRSFHPDALQSTLLPSLNPICGMDFKMLEGDHFLLKFFHALDRQRVLTSYP
ncbi:hypothetical protein Salat_2801100 [Sesamum alatum]|uniref:DUF4283 domain-containing protein n=1 Tax=Sesamum alatum TaxID=300844 RepID=A0AAE2C9E7_9LAMI|nr:hypothetical protein Salat_2801100 [Sesamum alatum]